MHYSLTMNAIVWLISLYLSPLCFSFSGFRKLAHFRSWSGLHSVSKKAPVLFPTSDTDSVANFQEYQTDEQQNKFIQCNVIAVGEIDGQKYGVGYPVNMPVMLTYFDKNELKPVRSTHHDYEHLLDHVALQLDESDLHLFKTPVVLTLEGEFEDEEYNQVDPFELYQTLQSNKRRNKSINQKTVLSTALSHDQIDKAGPEGEEGEEEVEEVEEAEEVSLEELMSSENISGLEEAYDASDIEVDDEDEGDEEDEEQQEKIAIREVVEGEEWGDGYEEVEDDYGHGVGSVSAPHIPTLTAAYKEQNIPFPYAPQHAFTDTSSYSGDITAINRPPPVFSEITEEDIVTEEDTKSLNRAHRRADKIMEYADDVKLMGSFHFKKKNYHLVRLLEPIFLIGKKLEHKKGDDVSFALLDQQETEKVRPILEGLLLEQSKVVPEVDDRRQGNPRGYERGSSIAGSGAGNSSIADGGTSRGRDKTGATGASSGLAYNKWHSKESDRYRTDGNKHFARHAPQDRRRNQNNVAQSDAEGRRRMRRESHTGRNGVGGVRSEVQDGVDDDQYERAREKWHNIKTNTDRRR